MTKAYYSTIRSGSDTPDLGCFENQFSTYDASEVGEEVEILWFGKGRGKYRTKNREALIGHPNIKCVLCNDLDEATVNILASMPKLEHLQVSGRAIPPEIRLESLENCRMVLLSNVKQLHSLDVVANMPALKSLFVNDMKTVNLEALPSLNLTEFALWESLTPQDVDCIFSQKQLEYLCLGRLKPVPEDFRQFAIFERLERIELNSSAHPFQAYASLDRVLSEDVQRNWKLLVRLGEKCETHTGHPLLQASGSRQRPFCELCSPKKLEQLGDQYLELSGRPLPVPDANSEAFGPSEDGRSYRFFT